MTSLLFFCVVILISGCDSGDKLEKLAFSGAIMGTTYQVTLVMDTEVGIAKGRQLADPIHKVLVGVDESMSTYKSDSDLSVLNRFQINEWVEISDSLYDVLEISRSVSAKSQGAFDITVGPLVEAWGFGPAPEQNTPPEADKLAVVRQRVGYQRLLLQEAPKAVKKLADISLDLSAVAKGYAVDEVAMLLDREGIDSYLIEVGGELRAKGWNAERQLWKVGVEQPSVARGEVVGVLGLENSAVATSGDYRNYFEKDGQRYSHTIDPTTGAPVKHNLASVTVVAKTAALADAWATAFNVMGRERARQIADEEELAVHFIYRENDDFHHESNELMQKYLLE